MGRLNRNLLLSRNLPDDPKHWVTILKSNVCSEEDELLEGDFHIVLDKILRD